jgi:hypothetical protein
MEAGVARQCSGNRCLARWTVGIPHQEPNPIFRTLYRSDYRAVRERGDSGLAMRDDLTAQR